MQLTPQQILANALRGRVAGPAVPPVPMLPGTSGVDIGATPAPSTGGFNLDQALMPSPAWAPKSPAEGDPITDMFKKAFNSAPPEQYRFDSPAPPTPRPRPMGTSPQMNYDAPPAPMPPGQAQMNYGDAPPGLDPMGMPDPAMQPPVPQPRPPLPGMPPMARPPSAPMPQGAWPPIPQARPDMQGPPMPAGQPEGIDSAGNVTALGAGMGAAPDAPTAADAMGEVSPDRAAGLWDRIRTKFDDPAVARNLMTFGLATLAASGRPGTSAASALGAGGLAALQQSDANRRLEIQQGQLARQEKRDDRRLSLEEQRLVQDAELKRQQWIEMANRADLDRTQRAEAAAQARELRRWQLEMQNDNRQASQRLQALIAGGNQDLRRQGLDIREAEIAQRNADRDAERQRKEAQDAQKLQQDLDIKATDQARRHVESLRNKNTGLLPEDAEQREDDFIRRNHPKSTRGQDLLNSPIEPPVRDVEIEPASGGVLGFGGTPAKTEKRVDRSKLYKGQLYTLPGGQVGRFNGSGFDPVGQ